MQKVTKYKMNVSIAASGLWNDLQHLELMGAEVKWMHCPLRHGHSVPCRITGTVSAMLLICEDNFGNQNLVHNYLDV